MGAAAAPAVELLMAKVEKGFSGKSKHGVTWSAARALGDIGEPALKAIPLLERASQVEYTSFARAAAEALEKLERLAKPRIEGLRPPEP